MSKRDNNNFISVILSKIELAKNFHQRVQLAITSRRILRHTYLVFYLRRRYKKLYFYTRLKSDGFGNKKERHNLFRDIVKLIPELQIDGVQGHYKGFIIEITECTKESLILFLKLVALLSKPKDFYVKDTKIYKSFYNYINTSDIPIHIQITQSKFKELTCYDLVQTLLEIKHNEKNTNNITNTSS